MFKHVVSPLIMLSLTPKIWEGNALSETLARSMLVVVGFHLWAQKGGGDQGSSKALVFDEYEWIPAMMAWWRPVPLELPMKSFSSLLARS